MDDRKKFKSVITKYCSSLRIVAMVRASIDKKELQVSIDAKGDRKSKRLKKLAKRMRRMEKELKKTFPRRRVKTDIWPIGKASPRYKVSKRFRGKDIIIITTTVRT